MGTAPRLEDLPARERHQVPGWTVVVRSDLGLVRRRLEDAWRVLPSVPLASHPRNVFAVFDGLGGLAYGQEAAWTAAERLPDALARAARPEDVLGHLNAWVRETRGATTALVALFPTAGPSAGVGVLLSAGDSAAYALDEAGQPALLTPKDAEGPYTVTDYLGHAGLAGHATPCAVAPGRAILLCSDGVDGVVGASNLGGVLSATDLAAAVEDLFGEIHERGAPDNATVVVARRLA